MKRQLSGFTLYIIMVYLTLSALNSAGASSQPSGANGQQPNNRRYARTLANLDVGEPYTVRVILFHPSDHQARSDIDTVLDSLVKQVQQFYADEMERHGFGRKTFRLETDVHDKIIVHRVEGKFTNAHYSEDTIDRSAGEVSEQFDTSKNINLVWIDLDDPVLSLSQVGGRGGGNPFGGTAWLPASNFDKAPPFLYVRAFTAIAHELGHAFGLPHDYRDDRYMMSYGDEVLRDQLSQCAAGWLDAHRYFNTNQTDVDNPVTIQMLESSLASPPQYYPPAICGVRL